MARLFPFPFPLFPWLRRRGRGAAVPDEADPFHRALSSRRLAGYPRAHRQPEAVRADETAGRRGQPRRRERHHRRRDGGAGGARWPHHAARDGDQLRLPARAQEKPALRPGEGFHSALAHRLGRERDDGQRKARRKQCGGPGKARKRKTRPAQLRLSG
ncbi:hypothetical protein D3C83_13660 [compost metagenome]